MIKKLKSKLPIILILLSAISYMLFANMASAQVIGNLDFLRGLVPCGKISDIGTANAKCTVCHFYKLIENIINFMLYIAASLATLMAAYIAFLFMFSGGSPAKITDAKSKLWLLVWGIGWVLGSWLVLNTILNFIVDKRVFPWPWNQVSCSVSVSGGFGGGAIGANSRLDNNPPLPAGAPGTWKDAIQTDTPGYQAIDTEHDGLELINPGDPFSQTEVIDPALTPIVSQADKNGVNQNLVEAIIEAESSGNTNAIHVDKDGQASFGLMQVRPDTARRYDANLAGLTDAQIGERLKDPGYNVEIGTAYLQDLAVKYGSDLNKVIAAYNGGPGANQASVDCPGLLKWQCQWDNTAQTIPNTGYAVTRNYVTKVNDYYSQLSQ